MSKQAATTFMAAVKGTIGHYDEATSAYSKKFAANNAPAPTEHDCEELAKIVQEMADLATVYHVNVIHSYGSFGGQNDTKIRNARHLLETLHRRAQEHPKAEFRERKNGCRLKGTK